MLLLLLASAQVSTVRSVPSPLFEDLGVNKLVADLNEAHLRTAISLDNIGKYTLRVFLRDFARLFKDLRDDRLLTRSE